MKKVIIALMVVWLGCMGVMAQATFTPTTKWPYLFYSFEEGTIFFENNTKTTGLFNIHLQGNVLHYVADDGRIYQSNDRKVVRVEMAGKAYLFCDHKLMEIRTTKGNNVLALLRRADWDAMQSGSGAYGASLNSSAARDLSSLDLGGLGNPELGKMLQEKDDGSSIPLAENYFFIIGGQQVEANKKAVERFVESDRAEAWKLFQKENKLKWKKEESLIKVLDFLSE